MVGIMNFSDEQWEWFITGDDDYDIAGKYLFFSEDRELLRTIALDEVEHNGFPQAKIPIVGANISDDYVLCLYYKDDSRKEELRMKYLGINALKYRFWKSNEDTRNAKYSKQFIENCKVKE
jgi:hypothetical protein